MPIEVHCPNPACARMHWVKDKYAGRRGRCPACQSWMYVPREAVPETMPTLPPQGFGWPAAAFLLLGLAGLGVAAAAPALPQASFTATGDHAAASSSLVVEGVRPEHARLTTAAPLLAALPALLALLGAFSGRTNVWSIGCTHLAVLAASALAFASLWHMKAELDAYSGLSQWLSAAQASGKHGDATFSMGWYTQAAAGGSAAAAALFLLAAFCLHRRAWPRVLASAVLGLPLAAGALWLFREELARVGLFPV